MDVARETKAADAGAASETARSTATTTATMAATTTPAKREIVFKVPSSRAPTLTPRAAMPATPRPTPDPTPEKRTDEGVDARAVAEGLAASPLEQELFDLGEDDFGGDVSPPEEPPSPETVAEAEAREDVARAVRRVDELKGTLEEMVVESTELLLNTVVATNDYFLLFNPKLMIELRTIKEEAKKWLEETAPKKSAAA
mmetsp:Transcript_4989/g.19195  ORF Transcript_4989/g.19195 Transcript_4989/m.19195 type:complete len:199 (-) Transcript_4989:309-905(-)